MRRWIECNAHKNSKNGEHTSTLEITVEAGFKRILVRQKLIYLVCSFIHFVISSKLPLPKKIPLETQKGYGVLQNNLFSRHRSLLSRQHLYNQDTKIYCKENE